MLYESSYASRCDAITVCLFCSKVFNAKCLIVIIYCSKLEKHNQWRAEELLSGGGGVTREIYRWD